MRRSLDREGSARGLTGADAIDFSSLAYGANVKATTRIGDQTPLFLATTSGSPAVRAPATAASGSLRAWIAPT